MALTNILSPVKTVNSIDSDVNAACSQLPYKFWFTSALQITAASASGANTFFNTISNPSAIGVSADDLLIIYDDNGIYKDVAYKIVAVSATGITVKTTFLGDTTGDCEKLEDSHSIELSIYDSTGTYLIIPEKIVISITKFITFFDLSPIIESYLDANNLNEIIYQLQYREAYTGLTPPSLTALDNVHAIRAKRQLLKAGGSNMAEYLLNASPVGKLLTKFENPMFWNGWKRRYYYVFDANYAARIGGATTYPTRQDANINKVAFGGVNTSVNTAIGVQSKEIQYIDASAAYVKAVLAFPDFTTPMSESLYYKLMPECRNPIMIEWLNSLGGYEQHLFELNQEFTDEIEDQEVYVTPINDDIETVSKVISKRSANYTQFINMVAQSLTLDQLRALKEIKSSNDVRLFLAKDGSSYINVVVDEGLETVYESDAIEYEYSLTIRLPENFDFNEGKEY